MNFSGKIAFVTGATRGIGRAVAEALLQNGLKVIIGYAHNDELADEIVKNALRNGSEAIAAKINLSDIASIEKSVKELALQAGTIDYLVNNAGIADDGLLLISPADKIANVINTNLLSGMLVAKTVLRGMIKKRFGSIVNMSSIVGEDGNGGQTAYAASKAGLTGFTKSLAKEVASRNIRVNAVAPGFIETDMTGELSKNDKLGITGKIALKRLGKPEDVANLVLFLLSDEASYITGDIIRIDGGLHL